MLDVFWSVDKSSTPLKSAEALETLPELFVQCIKSSSIVFAALLEMLCSDLQRKDKWNSQT